MTFVILFVFENVNIRVSPLTGLKFPQKIYTSVLLVIQGICVGKNKLTHKFSSTGPPPLVSSYEYSALQPPAKCHFAAFTSTGKATIN